MSNQSGVPPETLESEKIGLLPTGYDSLQDNKQFRQKHPEWFVDSDAIGFQALARQWSLCDNGRP